MSVPGAGLGRAQLIAYGALGLPLAFAALPVYVYAPKFYAGLGLSLTTAGAILLFARIADGLIDPWLGSAADRAPGVKKFIGFALIPLALGMFGLFHPPPNIPLAAWLTGSVVVVTFGFSAASIAYQAWGAQIGSPAERTTVTATREAFGLAGVILAALLPQLFAASIEQGLPATALAFVPLLAVCAAATLGRAPAAPSASTGAHRGARGAPGVLASPRFRRLLLVFALNGIASAIPATLFLFFVADVLGMRQKSGLFLALYFISAALALPLWVRLAARIGMRQAWLCSMALAIAAFVWCSVRLGLLARGGRGNRVRRDRSSLGRRAGRRSRLATGLARRRHRCRFCQRSDRRLLRCLEPGHETQPRACCGACATAARDARLSGRIHGRHHRSGGNVLPAAVRLENAGDRRSMAHPPMNHQLPPTPDGRCGTTRRSPAAPMSTRRVRCCTG